MRQAGFTLIEMLVTVALLALLAMLLFGGLRFGVRAWDGAQAHGAGAEELQIVQDTLRRELEQAYPRYDISDPIHPVVDFHGQRDGVTFLAPAPQAQEIAGRARISIFALRDGGDLQLAIRVAPELASDADQTLTSMLLRHVAAVRFAYFGAGRWSDDWSGAAALPQLVRIRVAFRGGDRRIWPDLIVAPQIKIDAGCIYDAAARRCSGRP